jgi:crossover junction endodeoxyribonuclease RuvC
LRRRYKNAKKRMKNGSRTRRILGIDPGLNATGYGVIAQSGATLTHVCHGVLRIAPNSLPLRLGEIFKRVTEVIAEHAPDEAAVEIVFVNVNPQSTLLLGQARGAAVCAAVASELPVAEYTALQVKQSVVGHGKAAKEQVQDMVTRLLRLDAAPAADAADALACAITHAHASSGPLGAGLSAKPNALTALLSEKAGRPLRVRGGRLV